MTDGIKISQLNQDTNIQGNESLIISDEGGSKRITVEQLANAEIFNKQSSDDESQNISISTLKQLVSVLQEKVGQVTTDSITQKTDSSGNKLYYQDDGTIGTPVTENPVMITNINTEVKVDDDNLWENYDN